MVKAPTCDPGNFLVAHGATATLFMPEIAKGASTPKRLPHVICFALLEVGFRGRVVRVGFAFDFDVSFNGRARGAIQPDLAWLSLVVAGLTEEGPIPALIQPEILLFEPVRAFFRVSSASPPP